MAEPFVGEICAFGFNFAPRDWAFCNGQIMSIQQNAALYSILGTTYGGNGTTTFGLPNLQGQVPMHWGNGPGNFQTVIGEVQGSESVTLLQTQIPQHTHAAIGVKPGATPERTPTPNANSWLSTATSPNFAYQTAPTVNTPFAPNAISPNGGSVPHDNMQPYLTVNFCIALYGTFPSRN